MDDGRSASGRLLFGRLALAGVLIGWASSCSHDTGALGAKDGGGTAGVVSGGAGLPLGAGGVGGIGGAAGGLAGLSGATGGAAGATFGSGGAVGAGGAAGAGGGAGTSGLAGTNGVGGTGGATGTGGVSGASGKGGTGGLTGTGGAAAGAGGAKTGSGGTAGRAGASGAGGSGGAANCVDAVRKNGYAHSGAQPCSACVDNGINRSATCQQVIDCLALAYPCSGNCESNCQNNAGATTVVMSCVDALVTVSCGGTSTGTGGSGGGTGPCAGLCSNPITVAPMAISGNLGTGATCHEVASGGITSVSCGNFAAPRTFTVNGTSFDCINKQGGTLPATRNGGYCMQASAGDYSYAYFTTY